MEHRHLFRALFVTGDDGDVVEALHARALRLLEQIQIALVVNVIGRKAGGGAGQPHRGDDRVRAVAQAAKRRGIGRVNGHKGVFPLRPRDGGLPQVGGDDLVPLPHKAFQDLGAQVAERTG